MDHLDEISVENLHHALDVVEGKKPTQRLLAAIAYKSGVTQTELSKWHNTADEQSTAGSSDSTLTSRLSRPCYGSPELDHRNALSASRSVRN
jgi:hypothetical protein